MKDTPLPNAALKIGFNSDQSFSTSPKQVQELLTALAHATWAGDLEVGAGFNGPEFWEANRTADELLRSYGLYPDYSEADGQPA